jgi:hypothetical protein
MPGLSGKYIRMHRLLQNLTSSTSVSQGEKLDWFIFLIILVMESGYCRTLGTQRLSVSGDEMGFFG